MPDSPRVQELLDELADSHMTPEEVCRESPELLAEVRARWAKVGHLRDELNAMFPQFQEKRTTFGSDGVALPDVAGYQVEGVVGRGGMGIVFRARHLFLNRVVALKMVLAGAYAAPNERERFRREAKAVAALAHPNVVQIHDVGESDGRPYFTMEFVDGGNLAQKLTGEPWPPRAAAGLVATLAGAVHAAHLNGIVHRDLKPANVLLAADGTPKVGDFGLARHLGDDSSFTLPGTALGTPSYMAPEQAAGKRKGNEPAVDTYAVGAILYELLTGRPPFRGGTAAETVEQVIAKDPLPPSHFSPKVPRDLETICLKCLHKEPRLRYAQTADLKTDLDRFLSGEAISARPERWLDRRARQARRRPVLSTLLAVGVLLICFATVAFAWLYTEQSATDRRQALERTAALRSACDLLDSMVDAMNKRAWSEARASLTRAEAALGKHVEPEIQNRLDQGRHDLDLVDRLNAIRLSAWASVGGVVSFARADAGYEKAFLSSGLGGPSESPDAVAARVRASNIRSALVAALDHWSQCAKDESRQAWIAHTAGLAGGDDTGWRERACTREVWKDEASLRKFLATIPAPVEQCVPLLLAIEMRTSADTKLKVVLLEWLHELQPLDFWVNLRLGEVMVADGKIREAIRYYRLALAIQPGAGVAHNNLAIALNRVGRGTEAVEELHKAISADPLVAEPYENMFTTLLQLGRQADAMAIFPKAVQLSPRSGVLHTLRARYLESQNQDAEALAEHRLAVAAQPRELAIQLDLRKFLMARHRSEEACEAWRTALEHGPEEHDAWYGYAEFALFLGKEEQYRLARRSLLTKFEGTTDPYHAERTSRTVLLRPVTGEELKGAVILADRAASADRSKYPGAYPAFLFARGLAAFRQGEFARAIATMKAEASQVLGPAPRLVTAMSLHRSGKPDEAKKILSKAVSSYNWRAGEIQDQDGWIIHVLRREAEEMILPGLNECLTGNRQPRDNNERLALVANCQFSERFNEAAKLYLDAFAADPALPRELEPRHRLNAARMAVLAACGVGEADQHLTETEKKTWRAQARRWLSDELVELGKYLNDHFAESHLWVRDTLAYWRRTAALTGVRELKTLAALPADEQAEWLALWREVGSLLIRTEGKK